MINPHLKNKLKSMIQVRKFFHKQLEIVENCFCIFYYILLEKMLINQIHLKKYP